MTVRVLLFQALRDAVGESALMLDLPAETSVRKTLDILTDQYPALGPYRESLLCARNEEWVSRGATLKNGDTLALMPPVSGG